MKANYVQRLRIVFAKVGPVRFIGHLDLARTLERMLNRAQIPLAYTQGYNPRPRMQLATALPLGFTSECEIADIWLLERTDPEFAWQALEPKAAPGIEIRNIYEIDLKQPALQPEEGTYLVSLLDSVEGESLKDKVNQLLTAEHLPRERRGKEYDLRPLILGLKVLDGDNNSPQLLMRLCLLPGQTGRPDEVLATLDLDPLAARIHRTELVLKQPDNSA
jgi:radical SAM-linked protein